MNHTGTPRKVTLGSCWLKVGGEPYDQAARLDLLASQVDLMAKRARAAGHRLDLALLPEDCGGAGSTAPLAERAEAWPGPTLDFFAAVARRHSTYLVVPQFIRCGELVYNSAVVLDRQGRPLGHYDKMHNVEEPERSGALEQCCTPGPRPEVFDLDFGRVGVQICFDLLYDDGWLALEDAGAELVLWPSAYPGAQHLGYRAWRHGYYIVSAPWRPPAALYDPTGHAMASAGEAEGTVLVATVDLEYSLLPWKCAKDGGAALLARYGSQISLFYREQEDVWLLWSNSAALPLDRLLGDNDLEPLRPYLERMRLLQDTYRGGPTVL